MSKNKVEDLRIKGVRKYIHGFTDFIKTPGGFFVAFAAIFGLLFVFLTPPLEAPDENSHFLRAYQVSDFHFIAKPFNQNGKIEYGSPIPISVNQAITGLMSNIPGHSQNKFQLRLYKHYIFQPLNRHNTQQTNIEAAGVYSPIVYIPQATGIEIGKVFHASPLILIWLGRLANLAVWIVAIWFAIKFLPFAKWALVVLALNPVAVFISASLSPDVMNVGFSFLFVSLIFHLATLKRNLLRKELILPLILIVILSLSKPVNLLFAFLLFLIPVKNFSTKKSYLLYCFGGLIAGLVFFYLWNSHIKPILDASVFLQSGGLHVSVNDQLSFILHSPLHYIRVIVDNYIFVVPGTYGDAVLTTFFGVFGWLDASIPLWTICIYLLLIFFVLMYQFGRGSVLTNKQKIIALIVFVVAFVGNITAMYFNATPVGSSVIGGVQGRYFLPISILVIGFFTARKKLLDIEEKPFFWIVFIVMTIVLLMTANDLLHRYYL